MEKTFLYRKFSPCSIVGVATVPGVKHSKLHMNGVKRKIAGYNNNN